MEHIHNIDFMIYTGMILFCILLFFLFLRRYLSYKKVRSLTSLQKDDLLNQIAAPLGYEYIQSEDLFITRLDAWQAKFGYEAAFDRLAVSAGMVFDCFPVYFDYRGKTWLLEFWKGQYGISVGGEIGIYHADHVVEPAHYHDTRFEAASLREVLGFGIYLSIEDKELIAYKKLHWWLGAFRVGHLIRPCRIRARYRIRFFDSDMKEAFVKGLIRSGYPMSKVQDRGNCVVKVLQTKETYLKNTWFRRLRTAFAWVRNAASLVLYYVYTVPFRASEDRLLFLYFQLPFLLRRMLNLKKCRRKKGYRGCRDYKRHRGLRQAEECRYVRRTEEQEGGHGLP